MVAPVPNRPPSALGGRFSVERGAHTAQNAGEAVQSVGSTPPPTGVDACPASKRLRKSPMSTSGTRTVHHSAAPDDGPAPFSLRIGDREVRADRNDELLAAVIGEEYLEESDPELLFLMRLEHAIIIATAVQESIVAAAVQNEDLDESTDEVTWTALLAGREGA